MKARFYTSFSLGLVLSALPFVGGCTEQGADLSSSFVLSANAEPIPTAISTNAPVETPPLPAPPAELVPAEDVDAIVVVPAPAAAAEKKLPVSIKPTPPTTEVIKLAHAGVDEAVMLNYITNATSLFVLNSDDIIYFNDMGVAGSVVTAMMQHDQELKAAGANPVARPSQVAEQAAAPTYVNPPQPEPPQQPQPAQVEAAPPPPAANVTDNYLNDSLSPYGTWVDVEGYGRCWQPTVVVVNRGWRPYCDGGRWIYTDHGWYWYSDYSWGAAAFHYGRWFSHPRYGWCWWPDTVWAPSWVTFRYSGDYCGWAPLPPLAYYNSGVGFSYYGQSVGFSFGFGLSSSCYTFVSWNRFCDNRPWHYRVPAHDVARVYNHTTVHNYYVIGNNNTVINRGISAEQYREHARTELRPVTLREGRGGTQLAGRSELMGSDRRSLVVNRPRDPGQGMSPRAISTSQTVRTPAAGSLLSRPGAGETTSPSAVRERGGPVEDRNRSRLSGSAPAVGASKTESRVVGAAAPGSSQARPLEPRSTAPAGSVVVIGKRTSNRNDSNPMRPSPTTPVPSDSTATPRSNPDVQRSVQNDRTSAGGTVRRELSASRGTTDLGYSQRAGPTYSASPNRSQYPQGFAEPRIVTPAPSYSAPIVVPGPRSTPAPSYTPRPSLGPSGDAQWSGPVASAPSYNPRPAPSAPPAVSAPRSAPVESRPAPSSNGRAESGGRNRP